MRKCKVILSWILTVCMLATLLTGFQVASAAPDFSTIAALDDESVSVVPVDDTTYRVKVPDGRPRIPQITGVEGTTVYQAFMPDNATTATATVIKDGTTYTVEFVKDASLGFVLQYDDYYTWNSGVSGATYSSSNTAVADVNASTGEIHIKKAGATVTITAAGSSTKTLTIKTVKAVLGIWMVTGQSNSAYNYNLQDWMGNKTEGINPKKGTAYYSGKFAAATTNSISAMTDPSTGKSAVGGVEPGIAQAVYNKTGEKVFIMNAGISGTGISYFVPGCSTNSGTHTWALINEVYETAHANWTKASFQENYETRMRSFFFLQGCAEVGSNWNKHYDGYLQKNTNAFTTLGVNYKTGSHNFHTYMTDVLGFDYCMDMMVAWRPVGIVTSTRTAQFKLAETLDDYFIASRVAQTFSQAEQTYRYDELHYPQSGKDMFGLHAGANAIRIYSGKKVILPATSATAYFNQIGFSDGQTLYVKAGDFYNYCTRPGNLESDDTFTYKFVGYNIVTFDGENDFVVNKNASAGQSAKFQIFSVANDAAPIATINIQVVGEAATNFNSTNSSEYKWTFENNIPTTVTGDIDLFSAAEKDSGFAGKTTLELSKDITLDSDGYWSIEWKGNGVGDGSMLLSSATEYAGTDAPNFLFVYHKNDTGWRVFRDSVYTDNFWRSYTGAPITGEHTFKLECRDNVYTFSIDGVVSDSRKIVEGHASYKPGSSYSGAGKFGNQFNVHYLLGGLNQNGISSTHYGYDGQVSEITIKLGDENPAITNVNDFPYEPAAGNGTAENPYILNVKVAAGTAIDSTSFTASAPTGTVAFSAEKFGGAPLTTLTCDTDKTVYAMALGSLAHMSTFYKINLVVSADPDSFPADMYPDLSAMMVDPDCSAIATGSSKQYAVEGGTYSFVKGFNLFASLTEAYKAAKDGSTIFMTKGTFGDSLTIEKDITIKGAQAGVNPNNADWTAARADHANETVITGQWTIACDSFTVDGVLFTATGRIYNGKGDTDTETNVTMENVIVDAVSTDNAFRFGDTSTSNIAAVFGNLTITNLRAVNLTKNGLILSAYNNVVINGSYISDGSRLGKFMLPDVTDGSEDNSAMLSIAGNMFDGATKANVIDIAFGKNNSKSADKFSYIGIDISSNTFKNTLCDAVSDSVGVINFTADTDVFTFNVSGNRIEDTNATAGKAFMTVASEGNLTDGNRSANYTIKMNTFVIGEGGALPMIISSDGNGRKNHNNINVGGNYAEIGGVVTAPITDTETTTYTGNNPVSFLNYYYTKEDLSESTCDHAETTIVGEPASCQGPGYEDLICAACGELIQHTDLPQTDHIPGEWVVSTPADCLNSGEQTQSCTYCNTVLAAKPIAKLGHDDGKWITVTDGTCYAEGLRNKVCTRCDEVLDSTVLPMTAHAYALTETVDATCTAAGNNHYTCKVCEAGKDEVIPQLLHTPGEWVVTIQPDCGEETDGYREIYCTECEIAMGGEVVSYEHTPVWSKPDTNGYAECTCETCGALLDWEITDVDITEQFDDLSKNDWFVKNGAAEFVVALGLYEGVAPGTFAPNANMTRAMFVTVLARLVGAPIDNSGTSRFEDVASGKWYTGAVIWATEAGIINGTSYYTFSPDAPITREQICKMIIAMVERFDISLDKVVNKKLFADDADISSWAKRYVYACQQAGIVEGRGNNLFVPQGTATRAEVATILLKLFNAMTSNP